MTRPPMASPIATRPARVSVLRPSTSRLIVWVAAQMDDTVATTGPAYLKKVRSDSIMTLRRAGIDTTVCDRRHS